ncbi:DUF4062 domain-containing protein [Staphylococcus xylosus]
MNNIKHQIFISSTYVDLIDERQKVVESVLECSNIPAGMELFTGENIEQWEIIKDWIDESDVFILLLGGRYGTLTFDKDISYIEKEYNYAQEQKIPTYVFILSETYLHAKRAANPHVDIFEENNKDKYDVFKDKLLQGYTQININSIDELKYLVNRTLINGKKNWSGGWIKNDNSNGDIINKKKNRDIELYKNQKGDLVKVKNIIKSNYENDSAISIHSMIELKHFCEHYGDKDPIKKYSDQMIQSNVDNMLQSITEYIDIVENHKIYLFDEVHFKFRPYGNKYGHRGEWVDISEEDMDKIENEFSILTEKIYKYYNAITGELEPYLP